MLSQHLFELASKTRFAKDRLGILVLNLGQQLVDQFNGERVRLFLFSGLLSGHCVGHGTSLSVLFHDPVFTQKFLQARAKSSSRAELPVSFLHNSSTP